MFLNQVGLSGLMNPDVGILLAMNSVVSAVTWQMSSYTMAMYLAGLRGIPEELREAARVDGAMGAFGATLIALEALPGGVA